MQIQVTKANFTLLLLNIEQTPKQTKGLFITITTVESIKRNLTLPSHNLHLALFSKLNEYCTIKGKSLLSVLAQSTNQ